MLISNAWLFYLGTVAAPDWRIWADSFVQFECFAAGILLCLTLRGRLPKLSLGERIFALGLSFAAWLFAASRLHFRFMPGENPGSFHLIAAYALGAAGAVLILVAFLGINPRLLPAWVVYLGRISFGLYVYHEFALSILNTRLMPHGASVGGPLFLLKGGITLGLTILMAALSYRYFETPFLKMKKRHAVIESQPIAGAS
jgi:peptidoglycan/LPS O-acetylase OafA/YrhL